MNELKRHRFYIPYSIIILLLLLYSCSNDNGYYESIATDNIAERRSTDIITTTPLPSLTHTITLTYTNKKTSLPTYTSLSKTPEESIKELYFTNGGCLYPCWWGITPGITTYEELLLLSEQFKGLIKVTKYDGYNSLGPSENGFDFNNLDWNGDITYTTTIVYPHFSDYKLVYSHTDVVLRDEIVSLLRLTSTSNVEGKPSYDSPNNILRIYGVPDGIYVGQPGCSAMACGLDLYIYYEKYHLFFDLGMGSMEINDGFYKFCGKYIKNLWTWEDNPEWTFERISQSMQGAKPLQEMVNWDNQTFTEKMSPYEQICMYFEYNSINDW
jgi:hypothetical protein